MVMLRETNPGPYYGRHFMNYCLAWPFENPFGLTEDNVAFRWLLLCAELYAITYAYLH